ncbi:MAG TPA: GDP-mannose 4,6-dehydratase [Syntrophobacteraceae bacterium]|jgi:GDPmannose 4,6-dehydratase|nr:GDP-mannose 4,6-dehydratase [Syntrophobacteraceae bacterium]HBZ54017.1 GDP-mannose 4,6-dehydratase [Syntrophobacteraceae bacterium]
MKRALITGAAGQDGSYLCDLLLSKGYEVHGVDLDVVIQNPDPCLGRLRSVLDRIQLHSTPLGDFTSVLGLIDEVGPDECYHLAAQSFVVRSCVDEFSTLNTNISGTHHLLAALQKRAPQCRFFFAASSEIFGEVKQTPQQEDTPFCPRNPYGVSKLTGYFLTRYYRQDKQMHASSGIFYNHESPRRGNEFVTRKITRTVADIKYGRAKELRLGNLEARRDWGFAPDYVEATWRMLQQNEPDDYVIATGATHSVREFVEKAFARVGLDWKQYVVVDEQFYRPTEQCELCGDSTKLRTRCGWQPTVSFDELVATMVDEDLRLQQ